MQLALPAAGFFAATVPAPPPRAAGAGTAAPARATRGTCAARASSRRGWTRSAPGARGSSRSRCPRSARSTSTASRRCSTPSPDATPTSRPRRRRSSCCATRRRCARARPSCRRSGCAPALRGPNAARCADFATSSKARWSSSRARGGPTGAAPSCSARRVCWRSTRAASAARLLVLDAFADAAVPSLAAPQPASARAAAARRRRRSRARARGARRDRPSTCGASPISRPRPRALGRAAPRSAGGWLRVAEARPGARPRGRAHRSAAAAASPARARDGARRGAREREREAQQAIASLHAYHLTARNCVTELLRSANHALGDSPAEIEAQLGGYLDPGRAGALRPVRLGVRRARALPRRDGGAACPRLRALRMAELSARDGPPRDRAARALAADGAELRAAPRPTRRSSSSAIRRPALRPLFGAANLATGGGAALVGLARAPFDAGLQLRAGLRGMLLEPAGARLRQRAQGHERIRGTHLDRLREGRARRWTESPEQ